MDGRAGHGKQGLSDHPGQGSLLGEVIPDAGAADTLRRGTTVMVSGVVAGCRTPTPCRPLFMMDGRLAGSQEIVLVI